MSKRHLPKASNGERPDGRKNNRPPIHTRFKPGESGNRSGRPKGLKSTGALIVSVLNQKVALTVSGKQQRISLRHAMIIKAVEDCMKRGNLKALAFLLQHYDAASKPGEARLAHRDEDERMMKMLKTILKSEEDDNNDVS